MLPPPPISTLTDARVPYTTLLRSLVGQVAMLANQNLNYSTTGTAPRRAGNAHQNLVPYQVFVAADGHLIVAVGNDSQFKAYCQAIDRSEEHTSELQSLMRSSYAVFCLKKKKVPEAYLQSKYD